VQPPFGNRIAAISPVELGRFKPAACDQDMVGNKGMSQTATVQDAAARPMSISQWVQLPEDEPGELVDGQLVEEEVPDLIHETVVSWLIGLLRGWIIARGGFVFGSEGKFVVAPERGRKPAAVGAAIRTCIDDGPAN
jgi:hypothetical protein